MAFAFAEMRGAGAGDRLTRLPRDLARKQVCGILAEQVQDLRKPPPQVIRRGENADGGPKLACGISEVSQLGRNVQGMPR